MCFPGPQEQWRSSCTEALGYLQSPCVNNELETRRTLLLITLFYVKQGLVLLTLQKQLLSVISVITVNKKMVSAKCVVFSSMKKKRLSSKTTLQRKSKTG